MKTNLLAGIGSLILMAIIVPTVLLMQKLVERIPAGAFVIALAGVTLALLIVNQYVALVKP